MKTQKHNQGELKTLNIKIEKHVVDTVEVMSKNSGMPVEEIVVIALKRFCSSHSDLEHPIPTPE